MTAKASKEVIDRVRSGRHLLLAQYEEPDLANLALEPVNVRDDGE